MEDQTFRQLPDILEKAKVCARARWAPDPPRHKNGYMQPGLDIWVETPTSQTYFFPEWEVRRPAILDRLLCGDFEGIVGQRPADYELTSPY